MQIQAGTVTVINGNSVVTGDDLVDWTQVTVGSIFLVRGTNPSYQINAVNSGSRTVTLSVPYAGTSGTGLTYAIARDFSPNWGLPLLSPGDVETATIFTRAMMLIDQVLTGGTGSGGGGGTPSGTASAIGISFTATGAVIPVTAPFDFIIGNAVRLNNAGKFELASAAVAPTADVVGVITSIAAGVYTVAFSGVVANIAQITITPGTLYYLQDTPDGNGVNIGVSPGAVGLPVLKGETNAIASNAAIIIIDAAAAGGGSSGAIFSDTVPGLVPAPGTPTGRFLRDDHTWAGLGLADRTVDMRHLQNITGIIDRTAGGGLDYSGVDEATLATFIDKWELSSFPDSDPHASPWSAIDFLLWRSKHSLTAAPGVGQAVYVVGGLAGPFIVPPGVRWLALEMWGGGSGATAASNMPGQGGSYVRGILPVTPNDSYSITLGAGGTSAAPGTGGTTIFGASGGVVNATGGFPQSTVALMQTNAGLTSNLTNPYSRVGFGRNGYIQKMQFPGPGITPIPTPCGLNGSGTAFPGCGGGQAIVGATPSIINGDAGMIIVTWVSA